MYAKREEPSINMKNAYSYSYSYTAHTLTKLHITMPGCTFIDTLGGRVYTGTEGTLGGTHNKPRQGVHS